MVNERDNFSKKTIELLAKRVGYLCSSPTCKKPTIGANEQEDKSSSIGIAAHICAASIGGKRYDLEMTTKERKHFSNGIWLCSNCATLIDKNPIKYTVEILKKWKSLAEFESSGKLEKNYQNSILQTPFLEVDFVGNACNCYITGVGNKNPPKLDDGSPNNIFSDTTIFNYHYKRYYNLVIHNNSSHPAYHVKIESIGTLHLKELEKLEKVNNLSPLSKFELKVIYEDNFEGDYKVRDTITKPFFPLRFKDIILKIFYLSEDRSLLHTTIVSFDGDEIINKKG